jgi:hypothetical protein
MKHVHLFVLTALILGAPAFAAHDEKDQKGMEQFMKYTTPGEQHAVLKDLVGNWKLTTKFWMEANAKPEESKGSQTNRLIMDGRFLQTEHVGKAMGKTFKGMGLLGYDKIKEEYQSVWVDSMSTSVMTSKGSFDASSKTLTEKGSASCPMTGEKDKSFRGEWKFIDKNNYTYAMYSKDKDGKEFRAMEIVYKRK